MIECSGNGHRVSSRHGGVIPAPESSAPMCDRQISQGHSCPYPPAGMDERNDGRHHPSLSITPEHSTAGEISYICFLSSPYTGHTPGHARQVINGDLSESRCFAIMSLSGSLVHIVRGHHGVVLHIIWMLFQNIFLLPEQTCRNMHSPLWQQGLGIDLMAHHIYHRLATLPNTAGRPERPSLPIT